MKRFVLVLMLIASPLWAVEPDEILANPALKPVRVTCPRGCAVWFVRMKALMKAMRHWRVICVFCCANGWSLGTVTQRQWISSLIAMVNMSCCNRVQMGPRCFVGVWSIDAAACWWNGDHLSAWTCHGIYHG